MTTVTLESEDDPVQTDFLELFMTMVEKGESRQELERLMKFTHLIPQYKVYVTPTLNRFAPA